MMSSTVRLHSYLSVEPIRLLAVAHKKFGVKVSGGTGPNPRLGPLNRVNGLVVLGLLATVVYSVEKPAQRLGPWP